MRITLKVVEPHATTSTEVEVSLICSVGWLREWVGHAFGVDAARVRLRRPSGAVLADDGLLLTDYHVHGGMSVTAWFVATDVARTRPGAAAVAAEPDGEPLDVIIHMEEDGQTFPMRVLTTTTARGVLEQFAEEVGAWLGTILVFAGKAVPYDATMHRVGVASGSTLRVVRMGGD